MRAARCAEGTSGLGLMTGDLAKVNAEIHDVERTQLSAGDRLCITRLPPYRALLQQAVREPALILMVRIGRELFKAAERNYADPFLWTSDLIRFDTQKRIAPHPFDLQTDSRKTVQGIVMEREIKGGHVGLSGMLAGQPAET